MEKSDKKNFLTLAMELERLYHKVSPHTTISQGEIRAKPYVEMENLLDYVAVDEPKLKEPVNEVLIKHKGMDDGSMDTLYSEGYDLEEFYKDITDITNCYFKLREE